MSTGDSNDITARLFRWLPTRWFPTGVGTRVYATMVGFSSALSAIFQQIAYVRLQTRLGTATDGFADLASFDYLGDALPRIPGETDTAYVARIKANIFLAANTRAAILAAVEGVTGQPARLIEPWQPNDNARYGSSFYGYNRAARPGQYADGNQRYKGLVVCTMPSSGAASLPRRGYGGVFYTASTSLVSPAGAFYSQAVASSGEQLVFDAINRVEVYGTDIFVKFVPPGSV